jgi:hypothetical protein
MTITCDERLSSLATTEASFRDVEEDVEDDGNQSMNQSAEG